MGPSTTTSSSPPTASTAASYGTYEHTRKAIDAIQNKAPVADIDFSIHVMEDGTEVSTQERVCKGTLFPVTCTVLLTFRK